MTTLHPAPDPGRLLSPLRVSRAYRNLMVGQFASQTAIWVMTIAAQVLLVRRGESTLTIALLQSAVTLPFLIFTIPSGVLADLVSRRTVLIVTNIGAVCVGIALTVTCAVDQLSAGLLLALTALLGLAWAVNAPSFAAAVPDIVAPQYLPSAGMLSSITFNAARVVGPALGGFAIALLSPTLAFGLSTLGFLAFAISAMMSHIPSQLSASRRFIPALRTGFRHVANARAFRTTVFVTAAWFGCGGALFALLPVVALRELGLGAGEYGWVMAALGGGAVVGTIALAPVRRRVPGNQYVMLIMPVFAVCLIAIGFIHHPVVLYLILPITGAAWTAVGAVLLAQSQMLLPAWVRARGLAYYFMASQGGMAVGAVLWGVVADRFSLTVALLVAGLCILPIWLVGLLGRLPEVTVIGEATGWPIGEIDIPDAHLERRAHVTVVWQVSDEAREEFLGAMRELRRSRRRTGARGWVLTNDVEDGNIFVERWEVDSWHDHLEQHEIRQSPEDVEISDRVKAIVGTPIAIRHYFEVDVPARGVDDL